METLDHGQCQTCCFDDSNLFHILKCEGGGGPLGEVVEGPWVSITNTDVNYSICPTRERSDNPRKSKSANMHATCGHVELSKFTNGSKGESKSCERSDLAPRSGRSRKDFSTAASKVTEVEKGDYIYVRAERGQATDRHSLAERARRGKISERMKFLQNLVPGCNKNMGKAGVLDEIISYVQSLQRQVEFLSMRLAVEKQYCDGSDSFTNKVLAAEMIFLNEVKLPSNWTE